MNADRCLKAHDLSVRWGDKVGLAPLNLTLSPEECTVVVGPSGAGKSTLIKALVGVQPLSGGQVSLDGTILSDDQHPEGHPFDSARRQARQKVACVYQDYCLSQNFSALRNVCFGRLHAYATWQLFVKGFSSDDKTKAWELLKQCGLKEQVHQKVRQLSGGQKQRVAIARALMQDGWWILADEPFTALDEEQKRKMSQLLVSHKEQGKGLLLVLHDLKQALHLADRLLAIRDGQLVFDDHPDRWDQSWQQKVFAGEEVGV